MPRRAGFRRFRQNFVRERLQRAGWHAAAHGRRVVVDLSHRQRPFGDLGGPLPAGHDHFGNDLRRRHVARLQVRAALEQMQPLLLLPLSQVCRVGKRRRRRRGLLPVHQDSTLRPIRYATLLQCNDTTRSRYMPQLRCHDNHMLMRQGYDKRQIHATTTMPR
jgi:hypothetical protein